VTVSEAILRKSETPSIFPAEPAIAAYCINPPHNQFTIGFSVPLSIPLSMSGPFIEHHVGNTFCSSQPESRSGPLKETICHHNIGLRTADNSDKSRLYRNSQPATASSFPKRLGANQAQLASEANTVLAERLLGFALDSRWDNVSVKD